MTLVKYSTGHQLCRDKYGGSRKNQAWRNCTVQIGGLAIQGAAVFEAKFAPTFRDYLNIVANASHGLTFEAIPLNFNQNFEFAAANKIDFIYSNPAAYVCMMVQYSVRTVASMLNLRKGVALDRFAGVIFTHVNSSFHTVNDLIRARVEAVSISGLGAMQLQQAELLSKGIDIFTNVTRLSFAYNQNKIVQDVQSGYADVGFVRTDMIDRSVAAGKTKWEYFRLINEIPDTTFPFKRSTGFTPEWPIGCMPHVPSDVAELVGHALMQLDADSANPQLSTPAIVGNFQTWTPPANYFGLLTMLENIGYYSQGQCLRSADVYQAINCPSGYVKRPKSQVFCSTGCKSGYDCLCDPCQRLRMPEFILRARVIWTSFPHDVNTSAVKALTATRQVCFRMEQCASMVEGQNVEWELLDQIGEQNRRSVGMPLVVSPEMRFSVQGAWKPMATRSTILDGDVVQRYSVNTTVHGLGTNIVQVRVNGRQLDVSPVVVQHISSPIRTDRKVMCSAGLYRGSANTCQACPVGTWSLANSTQCSDCQPGTFADIHGKTVCSNCSKGKASLNSRAIDCSFCTQGSFADQEGLSACKTCPSSFSTRMQGSASPTDCVCEQGFYYPCRPSLSCLAVDSNLSRLSCNSCAEGFDCAGNAANGVHVQPRVDAGKYALPGKPYEAYLCMHAAGFCLGGQPDQCGGGRFGLQCAFCHHGHYAMKGEACQPCANGGGSLAVSVAIIASLIVIVVLYAVGPGNRNKTDETSPFSAVGVVFSYAQLLAVVSMFNGMWPKGFTMFADNLRVMILQIEVFRSSCFLGFSLAARYVPGLLVPALICLICFAMFAMSIFGNKLCRRIHRMDGDSMLNTVGLILYALFVALCKSILNIFECRGNPSAEDTMTMYDGFLCFDEVVKPLLPLTFTIILIFIVGFPALLVWAIGMAPSRYHRQESFRTRFHFLLYRWNPRWYFFGLVVLVRNLSVIMIAIATSDGVMQLIFMLAIFMPFFVFQLMFFPNKEESVNCLEVIMSASLMITVQLAISLFDTPRQPEKRNAIGAVMMVSISVAMFAALVVLFDLSSEFVCGRSWLFSKKPLDPKFQADFLTTMLKFELLLNLGQDQMLEDIERFFSELPIGDGHRLARDMAIIDRGLFGEESRAVKGIAPNAPRSDERATQVNQFSVSRSQELGELALQSRRTRSSASLGSRSCGSSARTVFSCNNSLSEYSGKANGRAGMAPVAPQNDERAVQASQSSAGQSQELGDLLGEVSGIANGRPGHIENPFGNEDLMVGLAADMPSVDPASDEHPGINASNSSVLLITPLPAKEQRDPPLVEEFAIEVDRRLCL